MLDNNKLQELFDSFGLGLREYIKEEVKRQVEAAVSSSEIEEEEGAVVGGDDDVDMATTLNAAASVKDSVAVSPHTDDELDVKSNDSVLDSVPVATKEESSYIPGPSGLKDLLAKLASK